MKHWGSFERRLLIFTIIGVITISSPAFPLKNINADNLNAGVYSKDSKPFGVPYGEWIARYFSWSAQIPEPVHPRQHYTPERCLTNQSGPVWFLGESFTEKETRTCSIPNDKAILLPTQTGICWNDTESQQDDANNLLQCAKYCDEYATVEATLDGREIKDLKSYRAESPVFDIKVTKDNVWGNLKGESTNAVAEGYFIFLEPLPLGNHTLTTKTIVINPVDPSCNIANELTYNLMIKP